MDVNSQGGSKFTRPLPPSRTFLMKVVSESSLVAAVTARRR